MAAENKKELPKNRQQLVDTVLKLIEGRTLNWSKPWSLGGNMRAPVSMAGKKYRGVNNVLLYFVAQERGYEDNRWCTFNQMENNGWSFKKKEDGSSMGKGAGVPVEFFRFYDKSTKQDLDWRMFNALTLEEQDKYWKENVRTINKTYTVFNCSIIEGVPALAAKPHVEATEQNERAELTIRAWNDKQCKITHDGGDRAYYSLTTDSIHLPEKTTFETLADYYGTTLHEIGHATGAASRLNREMGGGFGSEKYATEELRAEFASMFMEQELGVTVAKTHIGNHAAYLQGWKSEIHSNPNVLFDAIKDADKIVDFINDNAAELTAQLDNVAEAKSESLAEGEISASDGDKPAEQGTARKEWKSFNLDSESVIDANEKRTTFRLNKGAYAGWVFSHPTKIVLDGWKNTNLASDDHEPCKTLMYTDDFKFTLRRSEAASQQQEVTLTASEMLTALNSDAGSQSAAQPQSQNAANGSVSAEARGMFSDMFQPAPSYAEQAANVGGAKLDAILANTGGKGGGNNVNE
ncbi:MAG: DUF1738 domain-containing protein [Clostridia bacterium]|nr:DUF1738 domain-containing protein [Clostridia bacterium]